MNRFRFLAFVACFACKAAPEPMPPATPPVTLTFLAMNDFHGALYEKPIADDPARAAGGLPWLVAAVESVRAEEPNLILLDGGDSFQGDWPVNASKGAGSVAAFELLKVDAAAIGNHEFDYGAGPEGTDPLHGALEFAALSRTQWLAANIQQSTPSGLQPWAPPGIAPWKMLEREGVRIAVIGLSTMETPQTTLAKNVADLQFVDPVQAVRDLLPEVHAQGADVVVVVAHLTGKCEPKSFFETGPQCTPDGEIGRLLLELPRGAIDLLVVGHAHTLLAERVGDTFVLENRSQGQALGRVDLVVGPNGVDPDASKLHSPWALVHERVDPGCTGASYPLEAREVGGKMLSPSSKALELIRDLEQKAGGSLCDRVACAAEPLGRDRTQESEVGNLVADAMKAAYPEADFAIANSGGLRADIPAGDVRREQVFGVMPFDNRVEVVELSGDKVLRLFRLGSSGAHGVLQVSGARYRFDPKGTNGEDLDADGQVADWERNRLCSATLDSGVIDPARTYKVVTSDFLRGGGDHLGLAFQDAKVISEGPLLRDVIADYLKKQPACIGAPPLVNPKKPRIESGECR